ncbi:MAG: type II secretion system protein M [Gammaproteobacteria bacterium]|jgi:general secretion pathway protein M
MKEWYNNLEPRERRILLIGAAVLIIAMLYLLAWEPLVNKSAALRKSIDKNQELVTWMEHAAEQARQMQAQIKARGPSGKSNGQSLLGIIDRTAKSSDLGDSVKRVQPDGQSRAKVWLEKAPFNDIVQWLESLQRRQGIRIVTSVIEKQEEAGLVNARLVLEGA